MSRYRRKREKDPVEALVPAVVVVIAAFLFVPGLRQLFAGVLVIALWCLGAALVGLVGYLLWRHFGTKSEAPGQDAGSEVSGGSASPPLRIPSRTPEPTPPPTWSLELLKQLEWYRFEQVVGEYHRLLGQRAELTDFGADGGVDVEAYRPGDITPYLLIQCKAWGDQPVKVTLVRELYGVASARKVANTAFYTTSTFTADAREFGTSVHMDLVDGEAFLARIQALPEPARRALLERAIEGDYTTPTCPSCGVKMILRTSGKGRSTGERFYGCRHYPRCKQTLAA
jgi:restriction system protein